MRTGERGGLRGEQEKAMNVCDGEPERDDGERKGVEGQRGGYITKPLGILAEVAEWQLSSHGGGI